MTAAFNDTKTKEKLASDLKTAWTVAFTDAQTKKSTIARLHLDYSEPQVAIRQFDSNPGFSHQKVGVFIAADLNASVVDVTLALRLDHSLLQQPRLKLVASVQESTDWFWESYLKNNESNAKLIFKNANFEHTVETQVATYTVTSDDMQHLLVNNLTTLKPRWMRCLQLETLMVVSFRIEYTSKIDNVAKPLVFADFKDATLVHA